ncbi:hypothetical protein [Streptomyces sp. NPDC001315]|uniref:hypothetical protein n=1 Tax=Streptomyces sp. NPDC001315 TaxID=3364562 RepID=UPI003692E838
MPRSSRFLCALYLATSAGLAWAAALEFRYGSAWAGCLFAAASLVPVIAVLRESVLCDHRRAVARLRRLNAAPPAHVGTALDVAVRTQLDAACCERWWTSLGTDHDSACRDRTRRSSAA